MDDFKSVIEVTPDEGDTMAQNESNLPKAPAGHIFKLKLDGGISKSTRSCSVIVSPTTENLSDKVMRSSSYVGGNCYLPPPDSIQMLEMAEKNAPRPILNNSNI